MAPGGHSISALRAMKKIKGKSSVANGKMVACLLGGRECLGKRFQRGIPSVVWLSISLVGMVCLVVVGCVRGGSFFVVKWLTRW